MNRQDTCDLTFSFVVPVYNEQDGLENFYGRLTAVAEELGEPYEIIFVDDGSQDGTAAILSRLAGECDKVRVVEFSRNFGHQVAVTAGYDFAGGRAVISLDADCQHPPEVIPQMVAHWREGFEVVYSIRRNTDGISLLRRSVGRLAYRIIRCVSGADLTDQADFRLLDRKAVEALKAARERARFVRGLVRWIGFRQTGIEYTAEQRSAGASSYSFRQLAQMASAGVFNYSLKPLRLAAVTGAVFLTAALMYAVLLLVLWPLGMMPGVWLHVIMAGVAMFGLQFLALGIMGEYIGRTFEEAKARPLYVVRKTTGFDGGQDRKDESSDGAAVEEQRFRIFT